MDEWLTIGDVAERAGVATSALRFYESKGLIESERTDGNQRRFHRSVIRVVSVIRAAQAIGLTLAEVQDALNALPHQRVPTKADWERMSSSWRDQLDERIAELQALRGGPHRLHRVRVPLAQSVCAVQPGRCRIHGWFRAPVPAR